MQQPVPDSASAEADSTAADEGVDTQAEKQPADSTEAQADETAQPARRHNTKTKIPDTRQMPFVSGIFI